MYAQANAKNSINTISQRKHFFIFFIPPSYPSSISLGLWQHGTAPACASGLPSPGHPVKSSIAASCTASKQKFWACDMFRQNRGRRLSHKRVHNAAEQLASNIEHLWRARAFFHHFRFRIRLTTCNGWSFKCNQQPGTASEVGDIGSFLSSTSNPQIRTDIYSNKYLRAAHQVPLEALLAPVPKWACQHINIKFACVTLKLESLSAQGILLSIFHLASCRNASRNAIFFKMINFRVLGLFSCSWCSVLTWCTGWRICII